MEKVDVDLKFIYWFAYYNEQSPSVRYRGKYPLEYMNTHFGIRSYFIIPGYAPKRIFQFFRAYLSALLFRRAGSLIVVQRVHSNFIYANLLRFLLTFQTKNTIYDLDDADHLEHPPEMINTLINASNKVMVGSNELKSTYMLINSSIILNTSPTKDLNITNEIRNDRFTIGWIGCFGGGHKESLVNDFFPVLLDLPFDINLVILGVHENDGHSFLQEYFKGSKHVELVIPQDIDWQNEHDIQQRISRFDVGIATLIDDELHRSKSAFKSKQYLNNGVPVLSSNLPENNNFVINGKNGFLCRSQNEFRSRLEQLYNMDQIEYDQMSIKARRSISSFNLEHYSNILIKAYSST